MADNAQRMNLVTVLRTLHQARTDEVIITSMGTGREWQQFEPHPLDFVHVPSSMGQTQAWGLGVALAQPHRRVIACCGDGSLLMNLGSLVTIANAAPPNFTLLVFDNGVYEVTGGQPTPASTTRGLMGQPIDLAAIVHQCGFKHTERVSSPDQWQDSLDRLLKLRWPGPACGIIDVAPQREDYSVRSPGRPQERVQEFAAALQSSSP